MLAIVALGAIALLFTLIATPVIRDVFLRLRIVDLPDARKLHTKPIPRIGGIPIVLSYAAAMAIMLACVPSFSKIIIVEKDLLWSVFPAALFIFATGLVDDVVGLKPWQKLGCQLIAAVWTVAMGARINLVAGQPGAAWITIPLSIIWLVGCTNAVNLIDGLDGLASGVGLFAACTTLLTALLHGNIGLAIVTVPLVGCLLGFLRYNFNPASVFLGDSGSLTIGFMLGCFGLIWSQKSATLLGMVAPMMALALPLLDVGLSISRRFLRNQPIFAPDRGHIHHRVLAMGFEPRDAALVLYGACGIAALLSLLQSVVSFRFTGLLIVAFCALSWWGIKRLRYVEFSTARRMLAGGGILRLVQQEIYLQHLREHLAKTSTIPECWDVVREACEDLDFSSILLNLDGQMFNETFEKTDSEPSWQMRIKLRNGGYLNVWRVHQSDTPALVSSFFEVVKECIDARHFLTPDEMDGAARRITPINRKVIRKELRSITRPETASLEPEALPTSFASGDRT